MRSHYRLMFIVAVATSLFPTSLFAEGSKARLLTAAEARTAFGPTFGPEIEGDTLKLFGVSTLKCLTAEEGKDAILKTSIDPKNGQIQILYSGANDNCLDLTKAKAESKDTPTMSLKDLTATKVTGTFSTVQLISKNVDNDREPNHIDELLSLDNKPIAHVSDEDKKQSEKEAADKKSGFLAQFYDLVLTKCLRQGGATALDQSEKALLNLKQIASYVKEQNEAEGADWADKKMAQINKRRFEAAKLIFERGRSSDFAQAMDILDRLVKSDDAYEAKTRELYLSAMKRLMKSTAGTPAEVMSQGETILAALKEQATTDKDDLEIQNIEMNFYASQQRRAAALGADSEDFAAASEKFKKYLVENDTNNCLASTDAESKNYAVFDPSKAQFPECRGMLGATNFLQGQTVAAGKIAQVKADQAMFQERVASCEAEAQGTQPDANGNIPRSPACTNVMNQYALIQKQQGATSSAANPSGSEWGRVYTSSDATTAAPATTARTGTEVTYSGLTSTGVGATTTAPAQPSPAVQTPSVSAAPAAPAAVVNTTRPSTFRR